MFSPIPNFMNGIQLKDSFEAELHWEQRREEGDQKRDRNCLELHFLCPPLTYNKKKNLFQQAAEEMVTITWD